MLMFVIIFSPLQDLQAPLADGTKFCSMTLSLFGFINLVQILGACQKKFLWWKTCKIWCDICRLQLLTANIFGADEDIQNLTSTW